jgi:glycosyltransferase involved in cell wall biosynthesis
MINSSGVGAYLKGCLPYFIESENDFLLIGDGRKLSQFGGYNVSILDCAVKPFSVTETFLPPAFLYKAVNKTDLFYSPYFNIPARIEIPVYTTIHDIIFPDMPELCSRAGLAARMWFYRRAFKLSKKLFTVSQFSKNRIEHYLGNTKPVIVTYGAVKDIVPFDLDAETSVNEKPLLKKSGRFLESPYILFIGNIKKHKGISCLLDAFSEARNAGLKYNLVIAGEKNNFRTSDDSGVIEKFINQNNEYVMFTGLVSYDELQFLIKKAALLVQPSLYEGFGLPPLEALVCGTPALISDIEVFKEIYRDFPVNYFRAGSSVCLKDKLVEILGGGVPPRVKLTDDLRQRYIFSKTALTVMRSFE